MKQVWLIGDALLWKGDRSRQKRVAAGTCLLIADDQSGIPVNHLAVEGAGVADVVPMAWLSSEPISLMAHNDSSTQTR